MPAKRSADPREQRNTAWESGRVPSATFRKVSHKWLQGYLNEVTWRYNHRMDRKAMFETPLMKAAGVASCG